LITRGDFGLYILPEYFIHTEHRGKPEFDGRAQEPPPWLRGRGVIRRPA
jgi:hypothetical protein